MSGSHYIASEDSALLRDVLQEHSGGCCLEIGAGNGGNLVDLSKRFDLVVGTDLVRPGMTDWKEGGANFVLADSASCVRPLSFDLVAFNPPYIPAEVEDRAVEGGRDLEVPKKFMRDALRVVKSSGSVTFLLNGEAEVGEFDDMCRREGFHLERKRSKHFFFEELTVYVASRQ
jgi:release factor glutamine methyltransferase